MKIKIKMKVEIEKEIKIKIGLLTVIFVIYIVFKIVLWKMMSVYYIKRPNEEDNEAGRSSWYLKKYEILWNYPT